MLTLVASGNIRRPLISLLALCPPAHCSTSQVALILPLAISFVILQRRYSKCSKALIVLEAKKAEPVLAAARDAFEGLITIRAFGKVEFVLKTQLAVALHTSASFSALVVGAQSWLAFRSNVVIYGALISVTAIVMAGAITPSQGSSAPIILSNIFQLSGMVGAAALLSATIENTLLAVARVMELSRLPNEEAVSVMGGGLGSAAFSGEGHDIYFFFHTVDC